MKMKLKKNNLEEAKNSKPAMDFFSVSKALFFSLIAVSSLLGFACQPNPTIMKDVAPPTPMETVETKKTSFEQDLRDMQTANFDYILVFRRRDGGIFDKDDRKYLRENTPPETNRFILTDEGKAFIAGSGFGFTPQHLEALQKRFMVEDYSKPEIKEAAAGKAANTQPTNTVNKNSNNAVKPPANK
jgi:hypothetical protein